MMNLKRDIYRYINSLTMSISAAKKSQLGKKKIHVLSRGDHANPMLVKDILLPTMPDDIEENNIAFNVCYQIALLFGTHQQGNTANASDGKTPFGKSLYKLNKKNPKINVDNKLVHLSSTSITDTPYYLRTIIIQLKKERIGLNYGELACDLYDLHFKDKIDKIHWKWAMNFVGRDFSKKNMIYACANKPNLITDQINAIKSEVGAKTILDDIITDIGKNNDFSRPGWNDLLQQVQREKIETIFINKKEDFVESHAFEWFEKFCKQFGTKLFVVSDEKDLKSDLLEI